MLESGQTETERVLSNLWAEVLQKPGQISGGDNFFELGGDSIMMMMMIIQVSQHFGVDLPPEQLFENATLSAVATAIDEMRRASGG
jgi:acyl carrier protein